MRLVQERGRKMADTLYAWTKFTVPNADEPGNPSKMKTINPGDQIAPADLGVEEDSADWQAYIDNGAVRPMEYPDTGNFPGSPVEFAKSQLAALAAEGGYYDGQ